MAPRTRDELLSYGVMDPAMTAELERNPVRAPQPSDPYYGRNDILAFREHRATTLREKHHLRYVPGAIPDEVSEEDLRVPVRDGTEITVRVYRPVGGGHKDGGGDGGSGRGSGSGRPLIVMYHEGAWCMGDLTDEEVNCRLFARELGAVCVNVEYRLAPEHPFPTWINDSWDVLKWAAANAKTVLGADPSRGFLVGGGSAGGNIAAVLAHLARDEGLTPPLTGQYLCVPAITVFQSAAEVPARYRAEYLNHPSVTPSVDPTLITQPAEGATRAAIAATIAADFTSPLMVPFLYGAGAEGHRGVPPAYFQACGLDPLRDEGLIYERVLREEAGVPTRLDLYPGYGHYFWTNYPLLPRSREFVEDTVRGVRWLLEQSAR